MPRAPSPVEINAALVALRSAPSDRAVGSHLELHALPIAHARTLLRVAAHGIGKAELLFTIDQTDARGETTCRITPEARTALLAQLGAAA